MRATARVVAVLVACALAGCPTPEPEPPVPDPEQVHPFLIATPDRKDAILARLDDEPYATVYGRLLEHAARPTREPEDPAVWDHNANGTNCSTAMSAAFDAWLHDDDAQAARAKELLLALPTDYSSHQTWDINIRMPHTLMDCTAAWDLLVGGGWLSDEESAAAEWALTSITREFFDEFVLTDLVRNLVLGPSQNNHPIRTASAIAYVGLAFPDYPLAPEWLNWSLSELDYLWGPDGRYVQPDGGVSEGPFYFGFAFGPAAAVGVAVHNLGGSVDGLERDCINRQDADPWAPHGCVDGELFSYTSPLYDPSFASTMEWSMALRLPWGSRAPKADGYFNSPTGQALLTSFDGGGHFAWDWVDNRDEALELTHGANLIPHHLAWAVVGDDDGPPAWASRVMPDSGDAVFRSSWDHDAVWGLLIAEHGAARKTLHDHVDGTSFTLAAYGEYLLLDPGYYKPNELDNARTAHSPSHNLVLIDGRAAPDKGLLTNFGDADAYLENGLVGGRLEYCEARHDVQDTSIERSVVFVDGRWFVIADRLDSGVPDDREHRWRMSGYAGRTAGGEFTLGDDGARWERDQAGVDVQVASTAPGMVVVQPDFEEHFPPYVHLFEHDRQERHHEVIDGLVHAPAPGFLAVAAPYRVGGPEAPAEVDALADLGDGVVGWVVDVEGVAWVALLREPDAPETIELPDGRVVQTDGELALWEEGGDVALLVRGAELTVDGDVLLSGGDPATVTISGG